MRRNRPVVVLAALGIIVVSIFGGALTASADTPVAPTIVTAQDSTLNPTYIIGGEVSDTASIWDIVVEVWNSNVSDVTPACTVVIPKANVGLGWTCDSQLGEGYNTLSAVAYENDGEPDEFSSFSNEVIIARGGTEPPVIVSPSNAETVYDYTPVFSGTGPVLGTVHMVVGPTAAPVCDALVDDAGGWTCEPAAAMATGYYADFRAQAEAIDASALGTSQPVEIIIAPTKPSMAYSFGPASATATATGAPTSGVSVELYRVTDSPTGYDYTIVSGCPTLLDTFPVGHERAYGGSSVTCGFPSLAPGIWNVYSAQVVDGTYSQSQNDFFRVPATPTIAARVNADRSVTIHGTGQAGGIIHVQTPGHSNVCQTGVVGTTWSCTLTQSVGVHGYVAYAQDQGFVAEAGGEGETADLSFQGSSAYSPRVSVTVPAPPAPLIRPWTMTFGEITEVEPGDEIVIEGADAPAGALVEGEIHSTPAALGSTTVDPDGSFSIVATIPEDTEPGEHHIVVTLTPADGSAPSTIEQPITVLAPPPPPPADVPADTTTTTGGGGAGPASPRTQPGAVSALSAGFVTPAEIISNPLVAATAGSLGLALVLLVLVPAEFFGESLANHYGSLAAFMERRKRLSRATKAIGNWVGTHRLISGIVLVLLTSTVFSFVDPGFGFDLTSLRLLLSCAVSILLVNFASAGITELVAERAWNVPTRLKVMPWGLAIAIVGVVASRILNFSPGFLIGSIIGVGIIGTVGARLEARVILLWSSVVWGLAVAAWALIGLVPVLPATDPAAFWTALLTDSLVATSAAGLTALLVALLPIALFDGGELFAYSKAIWATAFGIAAATFCLIVVPSASNWMGLGDGLLGWLLLTLGFITLAIIAYVFARRRSSTKRSRLLTVE